MKDLTTFTLSVIQELEDEGRFGTAHVYRSMLRAFQRYWESEHPKNEIRMRKAFDIATIHKFERHLLERMLKLNTMSTYLRMLRAVYNRALLAGLTDYVPGLFKHVYTGTRADVKRALPPAEMGQALDISASLHRELKEAQIWFALLFLLRGMPFADLARLRKCDFKDGVITYRRQKTGRQIRVHVTEEAAELIRRCADRRTDSPYLLNILGDENCRFPWEGVKNTDITNRSCGDSTGNSNCWRQPSDWAESCRPTPQGTHGQQRRSTPESPWE